MSFYKLLEFLFGWVSSSSLDLVNLVFRVVWIIGSPTAASFDFSLKQIWGKTRLLFIEKQNNVSF